MELGEICLQCGDRGFENAFIYCTRCLNYVLHRYCLDVIPETLDEFVPWVCDFCKDVARISNLITDPEAREFRINESNGVPEDTVHENGFGESGVEPCFSQIDEEVRCQANSGHELGEERADGISEARISNAIVLENDMNDENNTAVVLKPEVSVHENGFNEDTTTTVLNPENSVHENGLKENSMALVLKPDDSVHENGFEENSTALVLKPDDSVHENGYEEDSTMLVLKLSDSFHENGFKEDSRTTVLKQDYNVHENGFKENNTMTVLKPEDSVHENGFKENNTRIVLKPKVSVHENGFKENNSMIVLKLEGSVRENGFNESAVVSSKLDDDVRSKSSDCQELREKRADAGSAKVPASPLRENKKEKRKLVELSKEKDVEGLDSSEKSRDKRLNVTTGEFKRLESNSKVSTKLSEKSFDRTDPSYVPREHNGSVSNSGMPKLSAISSNEPSASSAKRAVVQCQVTCPSQSPEKTQRKKHNRDEQFADREEGKPAMVPSAAPVVVPVWRGIFKFRGKNGIITGLAAHISSKACLKVHDAVRQFRSTLHLAMLPKMDVWPKSFRNCEPSGDSIALFFFPSQKSDGAFDNLIERMVNENLALKRYFPGSELLIFTSKELPHPYSSFQGSPYLWGVFREGKGAPPRYINSCSSDVGKQRNKQNSERGRGDPRKWNRLRIPHHHQRRITTGRRC